MKQGKLTVTDGPFSEAKEVIGGYAVLQCKSREEAIERGRRFMQLHADLPVVPRRRVLTKLVGMMGLLQ